VARHRLSAQRSHRTPYSGSHELIRDPREVVAGRERSRAPVDLRATIQQYWADGLDVHSIVERLSDHGVTVQNVLVERYLHTG
jgi:hypothetical protein